MFESKREISLQDRIDAAKNIEEIYRSYGPFDEDYIYYSEEYLLALSNREIFNLRKKMNNRKNNIETIIRYLQKEAKDFFEYEALILQNDEDLESATKMINDYYRQKGIAEKENKTYEMPQDDKLYIKSLTSFIKKNTDMSQNYHESSDIIDTDEEEFLTPDDFGEAYGNEIPSQINGQYDTYISLLKNY